MKKSAGKLQLSRETVHHLMGASPTLRDAAAGVTQPITVPANSCLACFVTTNPMTACNCTS